MLHEQYTGFRRFIWVNLWTKSWMITQSNVLQTTIFYCKSFFTKSLPVRSNEFNLFCPIFSPITLTICRTPSIAAVWTTLKVFSYDTKWGAWTRTHHLTNNKQMRYLLRHSITVYCSYAIYRHNCHSFSKSDLCF